MADPSVSDVRKEKAAAAIGLACIVIVSAVLGWIGISALNGTLVGDAWPGRGLLLLMDNRSVPLLGKSIFFVIGFAAACLARSKSRDWLYYALIALCCVSALVSIVYLIVLGDPQLAGEMFNRSPVKALATYESYTGGLAYVFVPLSLWLIGMLSIQLGLKDSLDWVFPAGKPAGGQTPAPPKS